MHVIAWPVKDEAERRSLPIRSPPVTLDQRSSRWFDEPLAQRTRLGELLDQYHRAVGGGRLTDPAASVSRVIVQAERGVSCGNLMIAFMLRAFPSIVTPPIFKAAPGRRT
jgi:hypothetical protein